MIFVTFEVRQADDSYTPKDKENTRFLKTFEDEEALRTYERLQAGHPYLYLTIIDRRDS